MAADLAQVFQSLSATYTRREEAARTKLADCLMDLGAAVDTSLVRAAMDAAAEALPFKMVLTHAETAGIREALADIRKQLTRQLLTRSPGSSTCQIRNEAARMEIDAAQHFLATTDGLLERFDDTPAEEATPQAEPEPAPAPAPVDAPKVTPAQKRTLEAIRDNGVKLQEMRVGQAIVQVTNGIKPRKDMVEFAISQGWATKDTSTSLYVGQKVQLTALGEAILVG
ncbi:hypothetical protein AQJ11_02975 [Streptomyces corchorusii]|uniref:Uncharacterized protein n=2 Tax=Streptomyces TaxID=1883 RepID=A0A101QME1_STRCK|nr:hypothetical protein [Streptomyces corchorusii]KUN32505.1 hypothetical protein AQJ11_02975 [Streptomyces corchorusii]